MSPMMLRTLTAIRADMRAFPRAYVSPTALAYFLRAGHWLRYALVVTS